MHLCVSYSPALPVTRYITPPAEGPIWAPLATALTPGVNPCLVLSGVCVCASPPGVHPECYTANGEDYRGVQNRTAGTGSGKACLYWNETFQHPYNTVKYPNGEGGLGPHNYCRWVETGRGIWFGLGVVGA